MVKDCPPGKERNPVTKRCRKIKAVRGIKRTIKQINEEAKDMKEYYREKIRDHKQAIKKYKNSLKKDCKEQYPLRNQKNERDACLETEIKRHSRPRQGLYNLIDDLNILIDEQKGFIEDIEYQKEQVRKAKK
jgi:hypothetical protein